MKKILVVTYYWPPYGGTGVYRILKFVKYLRQFGYEPIILTAEKADAPIYDELLLNEVPEGVETFHSKIWEPTTFFRKNVAEGEAAKVTTTVFQKEQSSFKMKLAKWVRLNLFVPDAKIGWKKFAVKTGKEVIRQHQPELIFSTSPPPTSQLVARELAEWSGLPWVADFRDPWTRIFYLDTVKQSGRSMRKNEQLERTVLNQCTMATVVNRGFFPHLDFEEKQVRIPNGFDPSEFDKVEKKKTDQFSIRYFGGYKVNQFAKPLFQSLANLCTEKEKILIEFYGFVDDSVRKMIEETGPNLKIRFNTYVNREEMVDLMSQTDLGLVFIGRGSINTTGFSTKIFEYIASGLYVLGFGPVDGAAAQLLNDTRTGRIFDYENSKEVERFLRRNYDLWESEGRLPAGNSAEIEKFSFIELTRQLATQFDKILKED